MGCWMTILYLPRWCCPLVPKLADPLGDDSEDELGGEDVDLFPPPPPPMKIRGSLKHLVSSMKLFNACKKRSMRELTMSHPNIQLCLYV